MDYVHKYIWSFTAYDTNNLGVIRYHPGMNTTLRPFDFKICTVLQAHTSYVTRFESDKSTQNTDTSN